MCWKNPINTATSMILAVLLIVPAAAIADVRANLQGFQEVPSVSSDATGKFRAKLMRHDDAIEFKLLYSGLETFVRFAHIHFAERHVNGGIVVWLCDNTGNSPTPVGPCPQGEGRVEGVIMADDVSGAPAQGIEAGEFFEVIEAINAGAAYINVHTDAVPSGEIRGQIRGRLSGRDDDDRKRHDDD